MKNIEMESKKFYRTKVYQGKLSNVTFYRELLPTEQLKSLNIEYPDILIVDSYAFFFQAYEAHPVIRRFSLLSKFTSSYITRVDRKAGRIASLRHWWHVLKIVGDDDYDYKVLIDRDKPVINLTGNDGWTLVNLPGSRKDRKIDFLNW